MVPLALGSQTNGSTIRPASFCGVYGFKPTRGLVPRTGVLRQAPTLDQIGLFARSVEDLALLGELLVGWDEGDPATRPRARVPLQEVAAEEPPIPPLLAFVETPHWERAHEDTRAAFAELTGRLGDRVEPLPLLPSATEAWQWHQTIMEAEMATSFEREWQRGRERLSPALRAQLERGRQIPAHAYLGAVSRIEPLVDAFTELFEQRYDAILTPAAPGPAPAGLESTGDPSFCTLWTLCGLPALSLPLLASADDLPIGVQLVGPSHGDGRLLRTARWLVGQVTAGG
jgi:Asp-tRNA(Asn)/Glu-tRNA(Gln) amidotransferase A subunit family amidase